MHEDVAAEDEGVRVHLRYDAAGGGADVGEYTLGFGVFAEGFEIKVVDGRALGFVEGGPRAGYGINVGGCGVGVPWVLS